MSTDNNGIVRRDKHEREPAILLARGSTRKRRDRKIEYLSRGTRVDRRAPRNYYALFSGRAENRDIISASRR